MCNTCSSCVISICNFQAGGTAEVNNLCCNTSQRLCGVGPSVNLVLEAGAAFQLWAWSVRRVRILANALEVTGLAPARNLGSKLGGCGIWMSAEGQKCKEQDQ